MTETPLLGIDIDQGADRSLFEQVYLAVRGRILSGGIPAGTRLPASRKLAEELGVSRTTIVAAYDQLIAEGFASSKPGSGVFVSDVQSVEPAQRDRAPRLEPAQIETASPVPAVRPFQPGQLDVRLFPFRQWARAVARAARSDPQSLVISADPFGDRLLRQEICRYLGDWRSVKAVPEQILVTAGSGEALEICFLMMTTPGDRIALEDPGYPQIRDFIGRIGLQILWLERDEYGALPPSEGQRPKLVFLTPSSQFPLGGAMPQARRSAFLTWSQRSGGLLLEDDYDSEFRYSGRPVPALAASDETSRTLYVGSFSKIFSKGLRLGFMVVPVTMIDAVRAFLGAYDRKVSAAPQRALGLFMAEGDFYRHIRRVRRHYGERRAALIDRVQSSLGGLVGFDDHSAGMHIVLRLPDDLSDVAISEAAARQGLTCPPLSGYCGSEHRLNGLLLGFCSFTIDEINAAMPKLSAAIDAVVRQRGQAAAPSARTRTGK